MSSSSAQASHGEPPEGFECLVTMEDITSANYVEYQCYPSLQWKPAKMEQAVIEELLRTQFRTYIERVKTTDCQAELKRLLAAGPPVHVSDPHGLPLNNDDNDATNNAQGGTGTTEDDDDDTHIEQLWFASDNRERSAKLEGAVEGEEREKLWQDLQQFIVVEGKEEGDDEDDDKANTE
jgi:hypothetical protein